MLSQILYYCNYSITNIIFLITLIFYNYLNCFFILLNMLLVNVYEVHSI